MKTAEETKKEIIDRVLSREYGSWESIANDAYDEGHAQGLAASHPPAAPVSGDELTEFLEAVTNERNEFCGFINSLLWDSGLRTKCESLLIIYDQMRERLSATLPTREQGAKGCQCKQDYKSVMIAGYTYCQNCGERK
ncbi:MAG: hypothetical protein ABFC84_11975 [Veillonellales bacterium]